jgi:endonuclease/exonuclease/phosphatase family metal-dependent hydrolase
MKSIFKSYQYPGFAATILISLISNVFGQDTIFITKSGCPNPDGSSERPYHVIQSAISKAQSSNAELIIIGPGKYYENIEVSTPCVLTTSGSSAVIGEIGYQSITNLDVLTFNTHLAGDVVAFPKWQDYKRADDIADYVKGMTPNPFCVGFQEIWDEDLFYGGYGANGILPRTGSYYGKHGDNSGNLSINSGLAIMSKVELHGFKQGTFDDYDGVDRFAAKGWIRTTIIKDGFSIGIFNTHLQSGEGYWWVRIRQLAQLYNDIKEYRASNPNNLVFIMGDFNCWGETYEYRDLLYYLVSDLNGKDADYNSQGYVPNTFETFTTSKSNDLNKYFNGDDAKNGRLDYIIYLLDLNGSCEVIPKTTDIVNFRGRKLSEDGLTTNEKSDHWAVYSKFKLIRK